MVEQIIREVEGPKDVPYGKGHDASRGMSFLLEVFYLKIENTQTRLVWEVIPGYAEMKPG